MKQGLASRDKWDIALDMVQLIAGAFESEWCHKGPPVLRWSPRVRRANFWPLGWEIAAGPHSGGGDIEFTIVHEMAHWLDSTRQARRGPVVFDSTRPRPRRTMFHGPNFVQALHDVARAWYGKPERYKWEREYKSVKRYAPKEVSK